MSKYLIRVEGSDKEFTSLLPLVWTLLAQNEENRVDIITDENYLVPSEWMPHRCFVFNIPDEKKKTVFGVHHFAANLHEIFNVDFYVDFVNDFYSAFLGLNFKAKKKIGLAGGPKSYLYNYSLESFKGMFLDQKKLSVLEYLDDYEKVIPPFLETDIRKERETVLIDFSSYHDEVWQERLGKILEYFEDLKIYVYVPLYLEENFETKRYPERVEFFSDQLKTIGNSLEKFDVVISDNLLLCQLALLNGRRSFWMIEENELFEAWSNMTSSIGLLKFFESDLVKYGIDEERELKVISELEDYILNYDTLRLEPSTEES